MSAATQEIIAKELRRAVRRAPKLEEAAGDLERQAEAKRSEAKANLDRIRELRADLDLELYDENGKPRPTEEPAE